MCKEEALKKTSYIRAPARLPVFFDFFSEQRRFAFAGRKSAAHKNFPLHWQLKQYCFALSRKRRNGQRVDSSISPSSEKRKVIV
jgi:hypothetical protein